MPSCNWDAPLRSDSASVALPRFVAGPENRLAATVFQWLLSSNCLPANLFGAPMVLVGPSGTGKSFLVRGAVRHWSQLLGSDAVSYFTAIDFARQLRDARHNNSLAEFRDRLSALRLLVVEDLHRLPDSIYIQRELRDTLDLLAESDSVVVLTAKESPALQTNLETGMRDRLLGGLIVRLCLPGLEARESILRQAAESRGCELDATQIQTLAQSVEGPAPRLLQAVSEGALELQNPTAPIEFKQILALVARYFSLTQAILRSSARRKSLVYARGIAIHLARSLTNLSYAQIGKDLGGRDHTTVMNAQKNIEKMRATDTNTQLTLDELRRILTAQ